jgi:hypothetical protein
MRCDAPNLERVATLRDLDRRRHHGGAYARKTPSNFISKWLQHINIGLKATLRVRGSRCSAESTCRLVERAG